MKFLIIKSSSLGDIIHAFKALAYLRYKCPYAQIDWVVEKPCKILVERHPMVDNVHVIDTKKWRKTWWKNSGFKLPDYDFVFDLQGNIKSAWILSKVSAKLKIGFGWKSVPEWPNWFFTNKKVNPPPGQNIRDDYLSVIRSFFNDESVFKEDPFLFDLKPKELEVVNSIPAGVTLVCPSAAWKNKQLPDEALLAELKRFCGPFYFSWGTKLEKKRVERLAAKMPNAQVLMQVNLPILQHLMEKAALVITMDSLPLHLCGTTSTASLSFFGPSKALKYIPQGAQHKYIEGSCPYNQVFEKRCPRLRSCQSADCINALKSR